MSNTNPAVAALASALRCKPSAVLLRLRFLGLCVAPCSRCGGSGSYSYNQMDGSRCYGCSGVRVRLAKNISPADVNAVRAAVDAGALEPYLADLRARAEVKKTWKTLFDAWSATNVAAVYSAAYGLDEIDLQGDLYRRNSRQGNLVTDLSARAECVLEGKARADDGNGGWYKALAGDTAEAVRDAVRAAVAEIGSLDLSLEDLERLAPKAVARVRAKRAESASTKA